MKVESAIEMLLPTVQYGNLKLYTKVGLDTVTDLGRIEESQKTHSITGSSTSTEVVAAVARKMAIDELVKMKTDVDRLSAGVFELKK